MNGCPPKTRLGEKKGDHFPIAITPKPIIHIGLLVPVYSEMNVPESKTPITHPPSNFISCRALMVGKKPIIIGSYSYSNPSWNRITPSRWNHVRVDGKTGTESVRLAAHPFRVNCYEGKSFLGLFLEERAGGQ